VYHVLYFSGQLHAHLKCQEESASLFFINRFYFVCVEGQCVKLLCSKFLVTRREKQNEHYSISSRVSASGLFHGTVSPISPEKSFGAVSHFYKNLLRYSSVKVDHQCK